MITDPGAFARAIETGVAAADGGALVTFGVEPDCPHTGYGYIETEPGDGADRKVKRFVEKPSLKAAEEYLDAGTFYWNAGIFLFKAATMLDLLKSHAPGIIEACRKSLDAAKLRLRRMRELDLIKIRYAPAPRSGRTLTKAERLRDLDQIRRSARCATSRPILCWRWLRPR